MRNDNFVLLVIFEVFLISVVFYLACLHGQIARVFYSGYSPISNIDQSLNQTQISEARSTLINFYSTKSSEHTAEILSLFLGIFVLVQAKTALEKIKPLGYPAILYLLSAILAFIGYIALRMLYWSLLSSTILYAQPVTAGNFYFGLHIDASNLVLKNLLPNGELSDTPRLSAYFVVYIMRGSLYSLIPIALFVSLSLLIVFWLYRWSKWRRHPHDSCDLY